MILKPTINTHLPLWRLQENVYTSLAPVPGIFCHHITMSLSPPCRLQTQSRNVHTAVREEYIELKIA